MSAAHVGKMHSVETKQKMIESAKRRWRDNDDLRESVSRKLAGRIYSNETLAKMSKWQVGRKLSDEHKKKIGLGGLGKKRAPRSDEWLVNMSIAQTESWNRKKMLQA